MDGEKRFQVFVSSTYLDLVEERQAVVRALLSMECFPAGMELFPADNDDAWTLIEDVIADSDYYLLIIGGKYGSVDPELEISYTEREYDAAVRLNKPVMAFLHGEPGKLLAEQTEDSDERRQLLAEFRKKVESSRHVKYWRTAADLGGQVALSWPALRRRHPVVGWIKADRATSSESFAVLAATQRELEDLRSQLERARTEAPPGTESLAQGTELFEIPAGAQGEWWPAGSYTRSLASWENVKLTWDRAFGWVGLRMMQEADVDTVRGALCDLLRWDHFETLDAAVTQRAKKLAKDAGATSHGVEFQRVTVSDDDFQTFMLQLLALGLIRRSEKPRSVRDTAAYWTLTPYGHTRLVQLRALVSGEESLEREGAEPPLGHGEEEPSE